MADSYDFRGVRINIDVVAEGHGIRAVTRQLAAFAEFQRSYFRLKSQLDRSMRAGNSSLLKTITMLDKRAVPLLRETEAATQRVLKGPSQHKDLDRFREWHKAGQGAKYWQVSPRGRNLIQSYLGGGKMDVKGLEHLSRDQRFLNALANEISNTTQIRGRPSKVSVPGQPRLDEPKPDRGPLPKGTKAGAGFSARDPVSNADKVNRVRKAAKTAAALKIYQELQREFETARSKLEPGQYPQHLRRLNRRVEDAQEQWAQAREIERKSAGLHTASDDIKVLHRGERLGDAPKRQLYPVSSINHEQGRVAFVPRSQLAGQIEALQTTAAEQTLPGSGTVPDRPLLYAGTGKAVKAIPKEQPKIKPVTTKDVGLTPELFAEQQLAAGGADRRRRSASRMRQFVRLLGEGQIRQTNIADYAKRHNIDAKTAQAELGALAHGGYLRSQADFTGRNPRFISTAKVKPAIPEAARPTTETTRTGRFNTRKEATREVGGRLAEPESLSRALVPVSDVRTHGGRNQAQGRLNRRILRNFNAAQKNLITEAFSTGATYTAADYVRKFGVSHATALKHLRDLSSRGYFSQSEQGGRFSFRARSPRQIASQASRDNRAYRTAQARANQEKSQNRNKRGSTRAFRMGSDDSFASVGSIHGVVQDANAPIDGSGGRRPPPPRPPLRGRGGRDDGRSKAGPFYRGGAFDHFARHSSQAQLLTAAGAVRRFTLSLLALPTAAAVGAVAVGVFASVVAGSFQKAFVGVRKTVDATPTELARVREDLIQTSFQIPMSFKELAKGGKIAGQLGTPVEEIRKQVQLFSKFQVATEIPFEEGATSLMKSANVLGAIGQVENLASAIVHMGNTTIALEREMLPTIARISFWSKQMGFTPAETVGISAATASAALRPNQAEAVMRGITRKTPDILQPGRNAESRRVSGLFNELVYAGGSTESATELLKRSPKDFFVGLQEGFRALYDVGQERQVPIIENFFRAVGLGNSREKSTIARLFTSEKDIGDFLTSSTKAFEENIALQQEFEKAIDIFQAAAITLGSAAKAFMDTIGTPFNKGLRPFLELLRDDFFGKSRKNLRLIMGKEPSTAPYMHGDLGASTAPDFTGIRDQYLQLMGDFLEPYTRIERQRQSLNTLYDLAESMLDVGQAAKGTMHWMIETASSVNRFLATKPALLKFFIGFASVMTVVSAVIGGLMLVLSVAAGPLGWATIAAGLAIAGIGGVAFALGGLDDKSRATMSSIELFVDTLLGQKRKLEAVIKPKDSLTGPIDRYSTNEEDRQIWFRSYMDSIQDKSPAMRALLGTGALIESGLRQSGNSMAYLYETAFAQLGVDRDVFLENPSSLPGMGDLYKEAFTVGSPDKSYQKPLVASSNGLTAFLTTLGDLWKPEETFTTGDLWKPEETVTSGDLWKPEAASPTTSGDLWKPEAASPTTSGDLWKPEAASPTTSGDLWKPEAASPTTSGDLWKPEAASPTTSGDLWKPEAASPTTSGDLWKPEATITTDEPIIPAMEMGAYNPGGGHVTPPTTGERLKEAWKDVGTFFGFRRPRAERRESTVAAAKERLSSQIPSPNSRLSLTDMGNYDPPLWQAPNMIQNQPRLQPTPSSGGGGAPIVVLNGDLVLPSVKNAAELVEELSKMAIGIPFQAVAEKIGTSEVTGGAG